MTTSDKRTLMSTLLEFFSPTKTETEIAIEKRCREIKALQEYETTVSSFTAADDDKHTAVEKALGRFKTKSN